MTARVSLVHDPRHRPYLNPVSPGLQAQPLATKGPVETVLEWTCPAPTLVPKMPEGHRRAP